MAVVQTLIGNVKGPQGERGAQGEQGAQGNAATISVGSVTTVPYGQNASVQNSGTEKEAVLDFRIPQGRPGDQVTQLDNLVLNSITEPSTQFPIPAIGDIGSVLFGKVSKWFGDMAALVATKLNAANVVNNLTTTASGYALDARQGKALNDSLANYLTVRTVQTTIPQAHGSRASVTAPTVQGYTFVTWYAAVSKGWIGNVYFETPIVATSNIWSANYGYSASGNGEVVAYALYKKNV